MNVMIMSPGRRVENIRYFKRVFGREGGEVFTLDMSPYAPALYEGDLKFVVEKDFNNLVGYMDKVIEICKKQNVEAIITLIDPELSLIASNKKRLLNEGIVPIISDEKIVNVCFDKYVFYKELNTRISVLKTYASYDQIIEAIQTGDIRFPIFAKKRCGSGSIGAKKIKSLEELNLYIGEKDYIFQPYLKHKEYGVDVYFDLLDGKIKSIFVKEKLAMRSGETDKAISVHREDICALIMKLEGLKFSGPIDVDVFEDENGELYINEINPRFGGGYPHAYHAGIDFMKYIYDNLMGNIVENNIGKYKDNLLMLKHNEAKYLDVCDLI